MNALVSVIIDNFWFIFSVLLIISIFGYRIYNFFKAPTEQQLAQIKAWLLSAVILAEKEFGAGTGKLKLSIVYNEFISKFPWIAKIMTFESFSRYVDDALGEMKELLNDDNYAKLNIQNGSDK